ncbi:MAG TPA: type IV pilin protein [Gammaproteobacteria bacterium]|nr:type IV pilin protein [Gammaproteobacteria bacterium]
MDEPRLRTPSRRESGVTLIELMITVVVVAILATIAMPSYRQYTIRAHRTEAKTALMRLQAKQESYYLQHNEYADALADLGFADGKSENGVYTLDLDTAMDGQSYTASAAPTAGGGDNGVTMTDDAECASFTVSSDGTKSASPDTNGRCW